MKRHTRELTEQEKRIARVGIPFLRNKKRKIDANTDYVELLDLIVLRAWTLITCDGPPCCPNSWLLQVSTTELVYVNSWDYFDLVDDSFPGSKVVLARFPGTHRLLDVFVEGVQIKREWPEDQIAIIPLFEKTTGDCEIIQISELSSSVTETLRLNA